MDTLIVTVLLPVSGVAVLLEVPVVPAVDVKDAVFGTVNRPHDAYCSVFEYVKVFDPQLLPATVVPGLLSLKLAHSSNASLGALANVTLAVPVLSVVPAMLGALAIAAGLLAGRLSGRLGSQTADRLRRHGHWPSYCPSYPPSSPFP